MREILFRGKRVDNGEWVYGNLITDGEDVFILVKEDLLKGLDVGGWIDGAQSYEVIPETVGQYTGLRDKNGVKIFEGDVVMKRTYHKKKPCEVVFGVGCFHCGWGGGSSTADHPYLLNDKRIEVIGNKFDNPELLKGSAKNE